MTATPLLELELVAPPELPDAVLLLLDPVLLEPADAPLLLLEAPAGCEVELPPLPVDELALVAPAVLLLAPPVLPLALDAPAPPAAALWDAPAVLCLEPFPAFVEPLPLAGPVDGLPELAEVPGLSLEPQALKTAVAAAIVKSAKGRMGFLSHRQ